MAFNSLLDGAGLQGWAAQRQPTRADPPGLRGWVAQRQPTRANPPGLRGWVSAQPNNLVLTIAAPPDQNTADYYLPLTLEVYHAGAVLRSLDLSSAGRYALRIPPGAALTLHGRSPRYAPVTLALLLAPGEVKEVALVLAFTADQALASKIRRRYLPT